MRIPLLLQQDNTEMIKQKMAEAPDSAYEIGVFIGSMLPFVVLIIFALFIYEK